MISAFKHKKWAVGNLAAHFFWQKSKGYSYAMQSFRPAIMPYLFFKIKSFLWNNLNYRLTPRQVFPIGTNCAKHSNPTLPRFLYLCALF
jgi:hypothetical protein